jgi:hypothetical protein
MKRDINDASLELLTCQDWFNNKLEKLTYCHYCHVGATPRSFINTGLPVLASYFGWDSIPVGGRKGHRVLWYKKSANWVGHPACHHPGFKSAHSVLSLKCYPSVDMIWVPRPMVKTRHDTESDVSIPYDGFLPYEKTEKSNEIWKPWIGLNRFRWLNAATCHQLSTETFFLNILNICRWHTRSDFCRIHWHSLRNFS